MKRYIMWVMVKRYQIIQIPIFFSNLWNLGTYTSITKFLLKVSEYIYRGGWRIEIYNKGILIKFFLLLLFNILYYVRNNIIWDSVMIQKDIGALLPTIWMIIINIVCRTPKYDIARNTTKSAHMNGHWKDYDFYDHHPPTTHPPPTHHPPPTTKKNCF